MLYNSSWHISLGIILLTIIYHNVKGNEQYKAGGVRRNIFIDIKKNFHEIFILRQYKSSKGNTTNLDNILPVMVTIKKQPISKLAYYVLMRIPKTNINNKSIIGLHSDLIENVQKEQASNEIDIRNINRLRSSMYFFMNWFGKLLNISFRFDNGGRNKYGRSNKRQDTDNPKTLIIIVTTKKKVHEEIIDKEDLPYLDLSKLFTEDDLSPTILRQEYGNACIKVAIRKCYKALRRVNHIVCKLIFKCKSSFKSTFLLEAKRSCIKAFDYTKTILQISHEKRRNESIVPVRTLADEKREKFIEACVPYLLDDYSNSNEVQVHKQITMGNKLSYATHILRGKSDRYCQKFSRKACVTACITARDKVCSTYICGKRKRKAFKKECKNECKRSYVIKRDSSKSSSSSRSSSGSDNSGGKSSD